MVNIPCANSTSAITIEGKKGGTTCQASPTQAILPIEISSFEAITQNSSNKIFWTTASESNNQYQILERSSDGNHGWETIEKLDGAGSSRTIRRYEVEDKYPLPISYYRIKSIDFDGYVEYSKTIVTRREKSGKSIHNRSFNPIQHEMLLDVMTDHTGLAEYSIINSVGATISRNYISLHDGMNNIRVPVPTGASGLYYLQISHQDWSETIKIVKW